MSAALAASTESAKSSLRRPPRETRGLPGGRPRYRATMSDSGKIVIALDGMGGDQAPDMVVHGADIARQRYPEATFLLFGDEARLRPLVERTRWLKTACTIIAAPDIVTNDDKPTAA